MRLHSHQSVDLYEQKPKTITLFGIRISPLLESVNIKPQNVKNNLHQKFPAWCVKQTEIY